MRAPGFANTFATVAVFGLAFQAGVRRHNEVMDALALAQGNLARARLNNARLRNTLLKRQIAAQDAMQ
jgi:hypothetical protein